MPRGSARVSVLVAGVGCAGLFVTLALAVDRRWQLLLDIDQHLGAWPQRFSARYDAVGDTWLWIARLSSGWVLVPLLVGAMVWLWHLGRREAVGWIVLVMTVVLVVNPVVKQLVGRERPLWDHPIQVIGSPAFPSGHATNNAAVAGIVIVLATRWLRSRFARRTAIAAAGLEALLVGADRVFLGVHSVSDVLGGYLLAASAVLLGLVLVDPAPPPPPQSRDAARAGTTAGR